MYYCKHFIFISLNSKMCVHMFSHVQIFVTPRTRQAPLSMEFPRQEYWGGLPFQTPGDLPDPGIEPVSLASPALQADSLLLSHRGSPIYVFFFRFLFHYRLLQDIEYRSLCYILGPFGYLFIYTSVYI